jgi:hypothetical protein
MPIRIQLTRRLRPSKIWNLNSWNILLTVQTSRLAIPKFELLKDTTKGVHFSNDEEVKNALHLWLRTQCKTFFSSGITKLVERRKKTSLEDSAIYLQPKLTFCSLPFQSANLAVCCFLPPSLQPIYITHILNTTYRLAVFWPRWKLSPRIHNFEPCYSFIALFSSICWSYFQQLFGSVCWEQAPPATYGNSTVQLLFCTSHSSNTFTFKWPGW